MSQPTDRDIQVLATLARLELSAAELASYRDDLVAILGYVETLQQVDTNGVEPMTHAVADQGHDRADVVGPSLPVAEALASAPAVRDDHFMVPTAIPTAGSEGAR